MKAQLRCSNCGAEITNVNMSWGRRQWLYLIPFLLFMMFAYPLIMPKLITGTPHDFRKDLTATFESKRYHEGVFEAIGFVENKGSVDYDHLTVEAKLLDKEGRFLDQILDYISITVPAGGKETVLVTKGKFPEDRWEATDSVTLRVTSASYDRF